jgi:hypothetical protein
MTAGPDSPARGWDVPDDEDGDVDVRQLAGLPPPEGAWLWVTAAEPVRRGELTALVLSRADPCLSGGDVAVHVAPSAGGPGVPAGDRVRVRVLAAVAGTMVHVATFDHAPALEWPEVARGPVAFAMAVLEELEQHGADLGTREQVLADAEPVTAGFPRVPPRVAPAGG